MWQHQLQQCCLAWYATGVCPTDGHHNRQTWKQLAIAAADGQMLTFYIPVMTNLPAVKSKTQDVWNSGTPHSHHFAGCSMPCHTLQDLHVGLFKAQTLRWRNFALQVQRSCSWTCICVLFKTDVAQLGSCCQPHHCMSTTSLSCWSWCRCCG